MAGTRASLWLYGSGLLVIHLDASPPTRVRAIVDGAELPSRVISRGATLEIDVVARAWHLVVLEAERPAVTLRGAGFAE
jgi:hypothetical protein